MINCNRCRFSNEENICDREHNQRKPVDCTMMCKDFKPIIVKEEQEIATSDIGRLEDILE